MSASVLDNMIRGTPLSTTADATGKFIIQSKGRSLHVEVSSVGHNRVEREGKLKPSSQGFDYGADDGEGIHRADPASPVVFQLHKPHHLGHIPHRIHQRQVDPASIVSGEVVGHHQAAHATSGLPVPPGKRQAAHVRPPDIAGNRRLGPPLAGFPRRIEFDAQHHIPPIIDVGFPHSAKLLGFLLFVLLFSGSGSR